MPRELFNGIVHYAFVDVVPGFISGAAAVISGPRVSPSITHPPERRVLVQMSAYPSIDLGYSSPPLEYPLLPRQSRAQDCRGFILSFLGGLVKAV